MADREKEAKNVGITQNVKSYELKWDLLSIISLHMVDYSSIATRKLQADTNELDNAADRENTGFGEYKKSLEENKDGVRKAEEAGEEEDERLLVSKKMIGSSFSRKNTKEVTLIITPPPSIANVIWDRKISLSATIPQGIVHAIYVAREVTFSPAEGVKMKRLRRLKVSFSFEKNEPRDKLISFVFF